MTITPHTWKDTYGHRLGMHYLTVEPGRSEASLAIGPAHCNPNGVCHGGAIFTLADDSMGAAAHGLCPEGTVPTSTQINIHFARSARPGDTLLARTSVQSQGARTAVLETRVEDGQERLVALLTASYLFVEQRYRPGAGEGPAEAAR